MNEMMAGVQNIGFYTNLTIASMEDTGFYKGIYENAEMMPWGYHKGCDLINKKCLINEKSQFPDMFCDSSETILTCTSDRLSLGKCAISNSITGIPTYFQYFSNPKKGGVVMLMDYCPAIIPYPDGSCTTQNGIHGFYYGPDSRCLDLSSTNTGSSLQLNGMCVKVECDAKAKSYTVSFDGSSKRISCKEGQSINAGQYSKYFTGKLMCPSFYEVCFADDASGGSNHGGDSALFPSCVNFIYILLALLSLLLIVF